MRGFFLHGNVPFTGLARYVLYIKYDETTLLHFKTLRL